MEADICLIPGLSTVLSPDQRLSQLSSLPLEKNPRPKLLLVISLVTFASLFGRRTAQSHISSNGED